MGALDAIRDALPDVAKDVRLTMQSVLQEGSLSPAQRWGVAVASAVTARNRRLLDAVVADARREAGPAVVDGGLREDQVHDTVRIAATIHAAAVALESADVAPAVA